ncbi:MAG: anti-sigma factor family protein, partial [Gemmatimonadota bacterium]
MSDSMMHPEPERLEAYVEGSLPEAERAVVDSHVMTCARCQTATEEWRTLFAELARLPRPAPEPGFADRVLADVHIRRPLAARAAERLGWFVPESTRGWAVAAALIALPVLAGVGAVAWLLSRPWLSAEGLWL